MISVLVVEDDTHKLARVTKVLREARHVGNELSISHVGNATDALKWLEAHPCDLLILDLQIPRRKGESPHKLGGEELLRKLVRKDSKCHQPMRAVGLTSFDDLREQFRTQFEREGWVISKYDGSSRDWEDTVSNAVKSLSVAFSVGRRKGVLLPIHGIRTSAGWHRTLADVAQELQWICPIEHWWYGYFSIFHFLTPFARSAKVAWFRRRYSEEMRRYETRGVDRCLPSIVAHSFVTFILGNALCKYKDIHVDCIILCGSILPIDFPWDVLIANGQVQRVLHHIGKEDYWPVVSAFVVPGTGASGRYGFNCSSPRLVQEYHNLSHNEFFDGQQMRTHWFAFLEADAPVQSTGNTHVVWRSRGDHPWLSPILSVVAFCILLALGFLAMYWSSKCVVTVCDEALKLIFHDSRLKHP